MENSKETIIQTIITEAGANQTFLNEKLVEKEILKTSLDGNIKEELLKELRNGSYAQLIIRENIKSRDMVS